MFLFEQMRFFKLFVVNKHFLRIYNNGEFCKIIFG